MQDAPPPEWPIVAEPGARMAQRVGELIALLLVVLFAQAAVNLVFIGVAEAAAIAVALAGLLVAAWRSRSGDPVRSLHIVLWTLALLITALTWLGDGVRDLFVIGYPLVLVLAAMTRDRRSLLGLLALVLGSLFWLTLAELQGWRVWEQTPVGWWSFLNRAIILVVLAVVARTVAHDLRHAVARAEAEGRRAKDNAVRLAFLVQHDALTGLPNRLLVQDRFAQAVARSRRDQAPLALLVIDLDDFRRVNDSLGHGVGDAVLQRMAERLRLLVGEADTLGRLGADEFVIVSSEYPDSEALAVFAQRLLDGLAEPFERDGLSIACGGSIGVAQFPRDGTSFESLLNRAEAALARAKTDGRNAFRFADPDVDIDVGEHLRLVSELRAGIERGELELHYQPIVGLASGRVGGAEALVRWRHPQRGLVGPGAFIPLAERSGVIHALGAWALLEAAQQVRRWEARGLPGIRVSVNVSPIQLAHAGLVDVVERALRESGLPAGQLVLELTESSLVGDAEPLRARIATIRALGVGLSIDDFGTGYSNLGYLQRFDVQALKIDQRFVRGLADGPQGEAIVRAIAQLAASLGIRSVAEGIEDGDQAAHLRRLGCDFGQGLHFAGPMPAPEFAAWLRERDTKPRAEAG